MRLLIALIRQMISEPDDGINYDLLQHLIEQWSAFEIKIACNIIKIEITA